MHFDTLRLDHIGIRVTDLTVAEAFYGKLGFTRDPERSSGVAHHTIILTSDSHPIPSSGVLPQWTPLHHAPTCLGMGCLR